MKKVSWLLFGGVMLLSLAITSCNIEPEKTEEEKRKERLEESMDNLKQSLEDVGKELQNSLEGAGEDLKQSSEDLGNNLSEALNEMGESLKSINTTKDGEKIETASFREIKKIMPSSLAGLDQTETSGETNAAFGFKISSAEAIYEEDDQKIELNIVDTGGAGMAIMSMAAWSKIEVDRESKTEIEYTTEIEGYKAFVSYKKNRKRGKISVIIDDRFVVNLEGRGLELRQLEKAVKSLGMKKYSRKLG